MGELAAAVKDRILLEVFSLPVFVGLARGSDASSVQEETDPGYRRMPVRFTEPQGKGLRFIQNADPIIMPAYVEDATSPIAFGLLSHDQAGGEIIWTERLDRERTLLRGDMFIFAPGEIRIGLP